MYIVIIILCEYIAKDRVLSALPPMIVSMVWSVNSVNLSKIIWSSTKECWWPWIVLKFSRIQIYKNSSDTTKFSVTKNLI